MVGERGDLSVAQILHRRGHVAVDVASGTHVEALELLGEVLNVLTGNAGNAIFAGQSGATVALYAIALLGQGRPGDEGGFARLTGRGPRLQPL